MTKMAPASIANPAAADVGSISGTALGRGEEGRGVVVCACPAMEIPKTRTVAMNRLRSSALLNFTFLTSVYPVERENCLAREGSNNSAAGSVRGA
jgi:hypothetical protein